MRPGPRTALVVAGYGVLTLALFRPTLETLAHTLPAFHGHSADPLLLVWATSHVSRALFTDPLHLFDAAIYYPARHTLAFGDHMIGEALLGLPVWLATRNPLLEYNVLALASFVLCAWAACRHRLATGGGLAGAVAAGLVFSFSPYRLWWPGWLQLLVTFAMPLALTAWLRFVRDGRTRDLVAWIGWWIVHSLMGLYVAFYFALVMGGLALAALAWAPAADRRRLLRGTLAAPLVAGTLLAPTLVPYVVLRATQGHVRTTGFGTHWTFFLPGPGTWSGTAAGFDGRIGTAVALSFGPGFVTTALVLVGVWCARRQARTAWDRFVWLAHGLGLVLSLGIMLMPVEAQLRLPGFDMVRITSRAFHVALLFVAWFAGAAVDRIVALVPAARLRAAVAAVVLAVLALDAGRPPSERRTLPLASEESAVYRAARAMPEAVLYERTDPSEGAALAMYHAIFHGKTLVNGYSGYTSPGAAYTTYRLLEFPSPSARALLTALDVRAVLVRDADAAGLARRLASVPDAEVIARDDSSALLRVPPRPSPPPPPATPLPHTGWTLAASAGADALPALVDGDPTTLWRVDAERDAPPSLTVDLGTVRPIAGVRCARGSLEAFGIHLADVATSIDGVAWTPTGARFEPDALATLFARPADVRWWEARFAAVDARWVRLTNPRLAFFGGPWEIADLDVLTPTPGSAR